MNFVQSISSGFKNYASFSGRSSRSEFWYWQLFILLVVLPLDIVQAIAAQADGQSSAGAISANILILIWDLAVFLPSIGVMVRRLHDCDRSGWWYWIAATIVGIIPLIIWFCSAGTPGPNKYGDNPLGNKVTTDSGVINVWDS